MSRLFVVILLAVGLAGCGDPDRRLNFDSAGKVCAHGHWYFIYFHSAAPIFGPDGKPIPCEAK